MKTASLAGICFLLTISVFGQEPESHPEASEACRVGTMVLEISAALEAPEQPDSLETIARHGTDSRYYVMIRGWLSELLRGVNSQREAASDPALREKLNKKQAFLRTAIRRIDLE